MTHERHGEAPPREREHRMSGTRRRRSDSIFGWGDPNGGGRSDERPEGLRSSSGHRHPRPHRQEHEIYGPDDFHEGLPMDETGRLIASNKVEGTAVYGRDGKLGTIYNFMVDKRSGRVAYAVMMWGGFLGLGERYFPLPWDVLTYDERVGGYYIDLTERELKNAPSFDRDSEPEFNEWYDRHVQGYYGTRR